MIKCTIVLLDEVSCVVNGLSKEHNSYFFEKYGLFTKGYFFNPKFKLGSWDGKIRFFHKTGKTFINLLSDIVPDITDFGYDINIDDRRTSLSINPPLIDEDFFSHIIDPETNKPWKFRDYQVKSINAGISNSGGILVAATASGKTSICAALAYSYELEANFKSIIIVPDTTLTDQTREEYTFFGLDAGEYSGAVKDLDHQHVVATWQTLKNNPHIITGFNMIIVDECLDADTEILMSDGSVKKIASININDSIISYNLKTHIFEIDTVLKIHENLKMSTNEDMYELIFDNNTIIKVTGNHKILTTIGYIRADALTDEHNIINAEDGSA